MRQDACNRAELRGPETALDKLLRVRLPIVARLQISIEFAIGIEIAKPETTMTSPPERLEGTVDPKLLEILVCPLTKGPLEFDAPSRN